MSDPHLRFGGPFNHPEVGLIYPLDLIDSVDGVRWFPDGRCAYVPVLLFGQAAVAVDWGGARVDGGYWRYQTRRAAVRAIEEWDGTGEPEGWVRHPASGRCRPGGDRKKEYVGGNL